LLSGPLEQFLSLTTSAQDFLAAEGRSVGHFLHDSVSPESDSMMNCTFSFITAILLSSSSTAARLPDIAEADDLLCAGQSDAA
jgi:hypothetical protein